MRLTFLGTGTSHGIPVMGCRCPVCLSGDKKNNRTRCSLLVEDRGRKILIDTATEFRIQALREGISSLDAVLYTHPHADHLHGIDDLRSLSYQKPIPVYGSPETLGEIERRFDYIFRPRKQLGGGIPHIEPHPLEAGAFFAAGIRAAAIPLKHGKLDIFGYRIGNAAYLTDCGLIPDESRPFLEGLDVLVIDALQYQPHETHFSVAEALAEIARIRPGRAFLTHICHNIDHRTLKKELPPGVAPAYDGLKVNL
jgi:phosphoribosyl 1,2-cyclic phosphate phosphodiesterase